MFIRYGAYSHSVNEAGIVITRQRNHAPSGLALSELQTWQIAGQLHAATPAALTDALISLSGAYSVDRQDLRLLNDDGSATAHYLLNSQTITGVKVINPPEFPEGRGAEYTTYRNYRITVQAELPLASGTFITSQETLRIRGTGGPAFVIREPLVGTPVPIQTKQATKQSATQTGYSEGYGQYPFPSPPFSPQFEMVDKREIEYVPPARSYVGNPANQKYRINWSYYFECTGQVNGGGF